jgi:hypothetical protein
MQETEPNYTALYPIRLYSTFSLPNTVLLHGKATLRKMTLQFSVLLTLALPATSFSLISYLGYTSALKVEAVCSFETSLSIHKVHGVSTQKITI